MREGWTLQAIIIHLGIAAKEGQALSPGGFEQERMSGNFEGLVEAIESTPVVGRLVRLLAVRLQTIHNLLQKEAQNQKPSNFIWLLQNLISHNL